MASGEGTPAVLVVAGVDPTGGSGIAVDTAFLARLGVRAAPVVATLTVRTDRSVPRIVAVDEGLFVEALRAALETLGPAVRAIKTGLVIDRRHAAAVAGAAAERGLPLVVDPILRAADAAAFSAESTLALAPLVDSASLITPNAAEAALLAGSRWDGTHEGLLELARLLAHPSRTAAVTGGGLPGSEVVTAIAGPGGEHLVSAPRVDRGPLQGAGCAFAATAAGYLALGLPPGDAAAAAHRFVARALAASRGLAGVRLSPEPWSV